MIKDTEENDYRFIEESDLSPLEIIETKCHFSTIQGEFTQAKAEYVVFIIQAKKREHYFCTTEPLRIWVEGNPGLRRILEYIQKNMSANTVPMVVMNKDKQTVLLIKFEFGGRINYVTIKN